MTINSIPDLLSFQLRSRTTASLKAQLETVTQEAVTGRHSDLTKASNGRVGDIHLLSKALANVELENRINTLTSTRIDLLTKGIQGARAAINGVDTRAIVALSSNNATAITTVANEAETNLHNVIDALNVKHGARNLLSGANTDTEAFVSADTLLDDIRQIVSTSGSPVDIDAALDTYFDDPAGGFNTRIYQGSVSGGTNVRLGDGNQIQVDIRGNNEGIKAALRGLSVLAVSTSSGLDLESDTFSEVFSSGASQTSAGSTQLINIEAEIGIQAESIEKIKTRNAAETISLTNAYQALVSRDQFEAATELKSLETQLESSYILTSRLSNLSLVNFLR